MKTLLVLYLFVFSIFSLFAQDLFIEDLQKRSFLYFWETSDEQTGLTPDRYPTPSFSSVAAVGFALSSYVVGSEKNFITREQATKRVLSTFRFFWEATQSDDPVNTTGYKGFFYHFLHMENGKRFKEVELSSIDTVFFLAGVLSCHSYFDKNTPSENDIRQYAEKLYERVDWQWMQNHHPLLSMGWHPENGFLPYDWHGYNEAMLLYILALGSPTHPISQDSWQEWTKKYRYEDFYGYQHVNFAPLFGHQYSHIWIDFRNIQDDYMRTKNMDYFENSKLAVYANRQYCIDNPMKWEGYSKDCWGLTACDGPANKIIEKNGTKMTFHTYWARGACQYEVQDDGTIAPTAVAGSIVFAPEICIPTLKNMYNLYGTQLYGQYGFRDAFNLTYKFDKNTNGWFAKDWLGIDNGPIVLMIENYYSELIWNLMKKNKYIIKGLKRAGFQGGWLDSKF